MATPTRQQVVERGEYYFPLIAYIWGGNPAKNVKCWCMNDGTTQTNTSGHGGVNSGPYIASDCSGYVSWCWFLSHKRATSEFYNDFSSRMKSRTTLGNTIEESFIGIQIGDAIIRPKGYVNPLTGSKAKSGHIALYIGNNTILHCSTNNWKSSTSLHGMSRDTGNRQIISGYQDVISYDSSWSADYDPDEYPDPVPDWNQGDGQQGNPSTPFPFMDNDAFEFWVYNHQYTKKYKKMKHYRMF